METLKVKIIGCGDAFGSGGRLNTCFYVESQHAKLLIDCGATSLSGLKKQGIKTDEIDAVLITHFHGDHYGGIPFLLLEASIYGRKKKLTIISPPGAQKRIQGLVDLMYPGANPLEKIQVDFLTYQAHTPLQTSQFSVIAFPMIHTAAALPHGLKITIDNKTIAYSGDTSWTDNLIPLSKGADLFICECNFFSTRVKGHLSYEELKGKLKQLTFKRLLLTHFDDEMLNQLDKVTHDCATDGMEITL